MEETDILATRDGNPRPYRFPSRKAEPWVSNSMPVIHSAWPSRPLFWFDKVVIPEDETGRRYYAILAVERQDGVKGMVIAVAVCSKNDQFSRATGRRIVLNRISSAVYSKTSKSCAFVPEGATQEDTLKLIRDAMFSLVLPEASRASPDYILKLYKECSEIYKREMSKENLPKEAEK